MQQMGDYEVLSYVEMPECSLRILSLKPAQFVASHYHKESVQVYTVLDRQVEARVGDRTYQLRPYETVRIEKGTIHSVRAIGESALVLSLSIPPLSRDDQLAAEE